MERQTRLRNLQGEIYFSPPENVDSAVSLGATRYPHRIWRKNDWVDYYWPRILPKRLNDRQFSIAQDLFRSILTIITIVVSAWLVKLIWG